jgi:pimeloyl-ACP methyl ester carboxylesterase
MLHRFLLLFIASFISSVFAQIDSRTTVIERVDIQNAEKQTIRLDIYNPKTQPPKALIVVAPGTGGAGELFIEAMLSQSGAMDFDTRGGIVNILNSKGYAIAFFNVRGLLRLHDCIAGKDYASRVRSYVDRCLIPRERVTLDLHAMTSDYANAFQYLEKSAKKIGIPLVVLAISEGAYHAAQLIEREAISPKALVLIGAITESLAENHEYFMKRSYYFEKIQLTFEATQKTTVTFADVVKYGNLNINLEPPYVEPWGLGIAMGHVLIDQQGLVSRKAEFEKFSQDVKKISISQNPNDIFSLNYATKFNKQGIKIPAAGSVRYAMQSWNSIKSVEESLSNFKRPVRFLFGEHEAVVKLPSSNFCSRQKYDCRIAFVKGVGHALQDESDVPPKHALDKLVETIEQLKLD